MKAISRKAITMAAGLLAASAAMADWLYTGSTITQDVDGSDTPWTLKVTASGTELTVTEFSSKPSDSGTRVLDLNQKIADASGNEYTIVTIGSKSGKNTLFYNNSTPPCSTVVLPDTLTTVMNDTFGACPVDVVFGENNIISTLNTRAFGYNSTSCKTPVRLPENVVLKNLTSMSKPFTCASGFKRVEFGPAITSVGGAALSYCTTLTEVVLDSEEPVTFDYQSCMETKNLRTFTFPAIPVVADGKSWNAWVEKTYKMKSGQGASYSYGTSTRVYGLKSKWSAVLGDADSFTKWDDLSDAERQVFIDNFGTTETPVGYIKTNNPIKSWFIALPEDVAATATLVVDGDPAQYGAVDPAYGTNEGITETKNCTVTQQYDPQGLSLYGCVGWTSTEFNPESMDVIKTDSGTDLSYTFNVTGNEYAGLTWLWEVVARQVDIPSGLPEGCYVTTNVAANLEGYYTSGTTVSYTAVGDDFVRWYGAPDDVEDPTARTISFVIGDASPRLVPYFRRNWLYNPSTKKMTNGYATFGMVVETDAEESKLVLNWLDEIGVCPFCDLNLPVEDADGNAYEIVRIASGVDRFTSKNRYAEMVLPRTLVTINDSTFNKCGSIITIPQDNVITNVGSASFDYSGLSGPIKLSHCNNLGNNCFRGTHITSLEVGEETHTLPYQCVYGCSALTNLVMESRSLESFGDQAIASINLRELHLQSIPTTFHSTWSKGSNVGKGFRTYAPLVTSAWKDVVADTEVFTKWSLCTAADTNTYFKTFGANAEIPKGYTTSPYGTWLLNTEDGGTMLMLK